jgi:hypothetical protein
MRKVLEISYRSFKEEEEGKKTGREKTYDDRFDLFLSASLLLLLSTINFRRFIAFFPIRGGSFGSFWKTKKTIRRGGECGDVEMYRGERRGWN